MHVTMPSDSVHGAHLWSTPTPVPLARHHTIAFGEGVLRCGRGGHLDGPGDEAGPSRLVTRPNAGAVISVEVFVWFCQVVEGGTFMRRTSAPLRSDLPFRPPAPYL